MEKIKNIKEKVILTIIYLSMVTCAYFLNFSCIYMKFFNVPCPGCGMTRAFFMALRLDFVSAFKFHFMFWSVPILYLYFLFDGKLFKNKKMNLTVIIAIGCGFLINWIYRLC